MRKERFQLAWAIVKFSVIVMGLTVLAYKNLIV